MPIPHRRKWPRLHLAALYCLMVLLELYGRVRGVYRPRITVPAYPIRNSRARSHGPIVCFGDSLTQGFGARPGQSYPNHLAALLSSRSLIVLNRGVDGNTAADGLARLNTDILQIQPLPRAVIVGFGGNDLLKNIPPDQTFAALRAIVTQLHDAGCLVVLLGLRGSWLYKIDYETPFAHLAQETGALLVPLCLDGIWGSPWRMSDVAHPNSRGYRLLALRVATTLLPHL